MKRIIQLIPLVIAIIITAIFFYKSLFYGLLPVPTDTLIGLYHPWRDLYAETNPRGVPFKNFLITDPIRQQIPWRKIAIDQWNKGELPGWNPYSFLGVPLASNIQSGAYQFTNILFGYLSFPLAWTIGIMLQSFFGFLIMFMYLRNLKLYRTSAYFGAVVWAFCGFSISWLTWGTIVWTAVFIPLFLYALDRVGTLIKGKDVSLVGVGIYSLCVGLSGALMVLSGHAQIALYGLLLAFVYGAYRFWDISDKGRIVFFIIVSMATLLFGSYIVWKPFIQFYLETARATPFNVSSVSGWFLPWQHLVQFIAPDFFGNPSTLNYWGEWNYGEFIGYIGVIPLILSLSSLFLGGIATLWSVILIISLILMIESPMTHALYDLSIPIFSSLQPTRLMVVVDLSLSVLAAFGLESFLKDKYTRLTKTSFVISCVFIGVVLVVLYMIKTSGNSDVLSQYMIAKRNLFVPTVLLLFFGVFVFISRISHKVIKTIVVCLIVVLSIADLFRFGWKYTPFTPPEYFFPETTVISFLQSQKTPFRVMSMDDRILPPNTSGYYGIETIEGYDPLYPIDYTDFLYGTTNGGKKSLQRIFTLHDLGNPVLRYLNIRFVLSIEHIDNPDFIKVFEEDETKIYQYVKGFPRAYLSRDNLGTDMLVSEDESATITSYSDNSISIKVVSTNSRTLVILNRYDTGWHVSIDGKNASLFRVNGIFQGVEVPMGEHVVRLWYKAL